MGRRRQLTLPILHSVKTNFTPADQRNRTQIEFIPPSNIADVTTEFYLCHRDKFSRTGWLAGKNNGGINIPIKFLPVRSLTKRLHTNTIRSAYKKLECDSNSPGLICLEFVPKATCRNSGEKYRVFVMINFQNKALQLLKKIEH